MKNIAAFTAPLSGGGYYPNYVSVNTTDPFKYVTIAVRSNNGKQCATICLTNDEFEAFLRSAVKTWNAQRDDGA